MRLIFASTKPEQLVHATALYQRSRRGEFMRVYRASYLDVGTANPGLEVVHAARTIAAARSNPNGVVSGVSAAILHGLPLLAPRVGSKVVMTRPSGSRASAWVQPRKATFADGDVMVKDGVRVTTPSRTITDLAGSIGRMELPAAADAVLRQGAEFTLPRGPVRHIRVLRWVHEHASERSESMAESMSRGLLIDAGICFPLLQPTLFAPNGRQLARVDFASPDGLLGEFDGKIKYGKLLEPGQTAADVVMAEKQRENACVELGWSFTRWDWKVLHESGALVRRIRNAFTRVSDLPAPVGELKLLPIRRSTPPNWTEFFGLG